MVRDDGLRKIERDAKVPGFSERKERTRANDAGASEEDYLLFLRKFSILILYFFSLIQLFPASSPLSFSNIFSSRSSLSQLFLSSPPPPNYLLHVVIYSREGNPLAAHDMQ